jgi:hypothetical protein
MAFRKAQKEQAKLRITLDGPAGSGKTYSALLIAKVLGGKTALIDSEHGSASKYADVFDFDTSMLEDFQIDTYIANIRGAATAGYEVLIIDSLSHAWMGTGGALDEVNKRGGNSFTDGWKAVTPKQNRLIDTILSYPGHVISTLRVKDEYVLEQNDKGKTVPRKVGLAPIQRAGVEYEFDAVLNLDMDEVIHVTKTRCSKLKGAAIRFPDVEKMANILKDWVSSGVAPQPRMVPDIGPAEAAEISIREATTEAQLAAVGAKIKGQPFAETLKPAYAAKLQELRNAGRP